MSTITVYIGHSGERLTVDPSSVNNLDGLKSFVGQHGIQPRSQILLTSQGKQVRTQTLLTENELFVFDSSRLNSKNVTSPSSSSLASSAGTDFNPGTPPDSISNQNDLQAWQHLFRNRQNWANGLLEGCEAKAHQAEKYQDEQLVIDRSLAVAMSSLQQHIKSAEQKFRAAEAWAQELIQEQDMHIGNWEADLDSLRSIPTSPEFSRFIQPTSTASSKRLSQLETLTTLQGYVDVASVKKAANTANSLMTEFGKKLDKMRENLDKAGADGDELLRAVDQINTNSETSNASEPAQLLEEIEIVVKKISSDLEHVRGLPQTSQSVSQASKMALLHTRNYLPNLTQYCSEMNEVVRRAQHQRNNAADTALEHMRTLANVESVLAELYQDVKNLDVPQDDQQAFTTLTAVSRLPSVYGALLVESVRRREWVAKMKRDAGTLQEEVAVYQDEEDKRRKKWIKTVEDVAKPELLRSSVLGIEISLQNEGGSWPMVTRDELQAYLNTLNEVYGPCAVTEEMDQAIKDLDKPTRKQIKHAKAFKNGSMHEAAFGDTSLLLRGDEQYKSLRDVNSRLEEDLKGQRSRVRKLEDLLHRQTNIGRASTGDMFTPQSGSVSDRNAPSPAALPRGPSDDVVPTSHQRKPSVQVMEEKKLVRRVVDLEAELQAARDEASSRKTSDAEVQKQVEEAMSIKRDLMENMEAQQREFATERRNLEQELTEAKERVEELEGEIERLMGSRDDERTGIDARVTAFEREIARLKEDASGHAARAATEQDARTTIESKLEIAETARAEAESQMQKMRTDQEQRQEAEAEHIQLLATAHALLSSEVEAPTTIATLSATLEELARRSTAHAKDLEEAVAFAKSENQSLWTSNERQKSELATATQKESEMEAEARQTQERIALEEAKAKSLAQQLGEEQEQLRILRTKFADGETGSEVLRQRVADEEARAGKLAASLAEANSHINSLDVELMRLQRKHEVYHQSAEKVTERLDKRAEHAKEVSQRLFAQNSRLSRLLERLGLAISYQDDSMVVERASKMGSSTTMVDPHSQFIRMSSMTTSPPLSRKASTTDEVSDVSILRWPEAQSVEQENIQFEAFQQQVAKFNIDTVTEAIVKRLRDFEYTARKYNKEAKDSGKRAEAYKERSLKLKAEAQSKIAVKDFKEGDLALFLPTRGQAKGAWAAFNVGCPHYFLAEKEGMRLGNRDYIVARINKIEQKVVDLSKAIPQPPADARSLGEASEVASLMDDDNPFDLSDGLTWWMVHATEERGVGSGLLGAPTTPGLGKSTVAAAPVDAKAIRVQRHSSDNASKSLNKTLDSRRSSSTSTRKGVTGANADAVAVAASSPAGQQLQRPESQASSVGRPLPAAATSTGVVASTGLGITAPAEAEVQPPPPPVAQNEQGGTSLSNERLRSDSRAASPTKSRQRSKSPSKSVRSLQRHLEGRASPAKAVPSPAKATPVKKQGWESLWQGEFEIGSPSKSAGGGGK